MPAADVFRKRAHARLIGNIQDRRRHQRGFLTEQLCSFRQRRFINIGNRQGRTCRRELLRERPPDAGTRPCHHGDSMTQK